jgi:hypothetical protein
MISGFIERDTFTFLSLIQEHEDQSGKENHKKRNTSDVYKPNFLAM